MAIVKSSCEPNKNQESLWQHVSGLIMLHFQFSNSKCSSNLCKQDPKFEYAGWTVIVIDFRLYYLLLTEVWNRRWSNDAMERCYRKLAAIFNFICKSSYIEVFRYSSIRLTWSTHRRIRPYDNATISSSRGQKPFEYRIDNTFKTKKVRGLDLSSIQG